MLYSIVYYTHPKIGAYRWASRLEAETLGSTRTQLPAGSCDRAKTISYLVPRAKGQGLHFRISISGLAHLSHLCCCCCVVLHCTSTRGCGKSAMEGERPNERSSPNLKICSRPHTHTIFILIELRWSKISRRYTGKVKTNYGVEATAVCIFRNEP
eukprot:scaffold11300_cov32-Tisochrysis_lutea.AAC.3